ncbi:MAG: Flp pilus assembly complex ATPase component TadA [Lachnospiraceae bacterium]|nr:Flp pilus assembly complex ATPase component TadA [Lachnospiraceae bacterium]
MRQQELLRSRLMEQLETAGDLSDEEILDLIDELILAENRSWLLGVYEKEELRRGLFYSVRRLDIIQELLEDPEVTEIMVNGHEQIFVERQGRIRLWEKCFSSRERLEDVIQQIAAFCNRVANEQRPIMDARLPGGERVNVVLPPIALNGPVMTIRRFPEEPITMEQMIRWGTITEEAAEYLRRLVRSGYSILVGGGTSTGKTTFLNALSSYIPEEERVITIEDNAELQIQGIANLVKLEARSANLDENKEISIRDLIRTALRMRPSRIIVGEVRSAEAADFLTCLNTGHSGSLGSAHANSVRDMIARLEMMVLMGLQIPIPAIRRQIASGVEILIHLSRTGEGHRQIQEIAEITGMEGDEILISTIFSRNREGELEKVGELQSREKWERSL